LPDSTISKALAKLGRSVPDIFAHCVRSDSADAERLTETRPFIHQDSEESGQLRPGGWKGEL